jgi:hypothetical protein
MEIIFAVKLNNGFNFVCPYQIKLTQFRESDCLSLFFVLISTHVLLQEHIFDILLGQLGVESQKVVLVNQLRNQSGVGEVQSFSRLYAGIFYSLQGYP